MVKERLNELVNENTGLAEQVSDKEIGLKCLRLEIERLEKELRVQGVNIDVRYKPRISYDRSFYLGILLTGPFCQNRRANNGERQSFASTFSRDSGT